MPPFDRARHAVARIAAAIVAAQLLLPGAAAAQTSPQQAPEPVQTALQTAWRQHPSYRVTEAQLAASRARLDAAAQPLYNPALELVVDDEGPDRTRTAGVSLTLDLSGKRRARRDAATAGVTQAEAEARLRRRDFLQQWVDAWVDLRATDQRVGIGERRLGLVSRFADLARRQFAADDISGLDRDVAQLARDEAEAEQSELISGRAEAESRFRSLGGTPELAAELPLPEDSPEPPVVLDEAALRRRPEWRIAEAAALTAEREVTVARRNRVPDPTVGISGGRVDYGGASDDVFGVRLSVPLPVRNSYRAEVVEARAEAEAADADADRVRVELAAESRRTVDSFAASLRAWNRWTASRGTDVDRRAELLERLWREGELSTSDYLLQLNQTLDTALAGAALHARLWRDYTDYLAAGGQLERWTGLEDTP